MQNVGDQKISGGAIQQSSVCVYVAVLDSVYFYVVAAKIGVTNSVRGFLASIDTSPMHGFDMIRHGSSKATTMSNVR